MRPYIFLSFAAVIVFGYNSQDLFDLFPNKNGWKRLSKTLKNDHEVPKYVRIYAEPFKQLQKSSRNDTITVGMIKQSVLIALHLTIEASKTFKLRKQDFRSRDMKDIRSMINKALTTFDLRMAEKLSPVFTPLALKNFASQRFEDMFFANKKYGDFRKERSQFENKLKQLRADLKKAKGSDLRNLILITADIEEIEKRTSRNLIAFRNEVDYIKMDEDFQKAETRVKKLGSDASSVKVEAMFLILCFAIYFVLS
jgi:hypothetical protein